jgi:hypothetical protein
LASWQAPIINDFPFPASSHRPRVRCLTWRSITWRSRPGLGDLPFTFQYILMNCSSLSLQSFLFAFCFLFNLLSLVQNGFIFFQNSRVHFSGIQHTRSIISNTTSSWGKSKRHRNSSVKCRRQKYHFKPVHSSVQQQRHRRCCLHASSVSDYCLAETKSFSKRQGREIIGDKNGRVLHVRLEGHEFGSGG